MWQRSHGSSEERKLELRLGPPSEDSLNESIKKCITERNESPLSLGYFSTHEISASDKPGPGGAMVPTAWSSASYHQHQAKPSYFQLQSRPQNVLMMRKEVPQLCCVENKTFSPSSAEAAVSTRTASGAVVGWPPIRSFRKNIASGSSSKLHTGSQQYQHFVPDNVASQKPTHNCGKGLFVKINMDGVPIGRKLNINAYDSYEKLSSGVDELFRGLLAEMKLSHIASSHCCSAQRDSCAGGIQNKGEEEKEKANTSFLVGSGEYTLVYEDNEGDKMLVGDVPWHMFVSTVKRLRVLKSSDLPAFTLVSNSHTT
ncbi:auxin-responsive protein IAA2-like isoform X1 [Vigna umbellata]|uniref:Auxin-induced protein n=1 Tax=Vigna angularis var. angularis TaxID=157739 RepID=A0A0S3SZX1_PHAAN|nr:auxin-responsive protein IAA2-like isoform X1 [Vigna umbellata]XP_052723998.1 auxin-responsive protein IAA2 isoform X2 [Vigna angularis]BAT98468.1 hypothetical protein VIGAN_09212600 [Vigna angularis var. angularis]